MPQLATALRTSRLDRATRLKDKKALAGIVADTVEYARSLGNCDVVGEPIGIAMDACGEALADRLGHGFDRDLLDAWEADCRKAFSV